MIPTSWIITVSDFSPGMVEQARQRLAALDLPFTVVRADVQDLPFPDQSWDVAIANFMLYHVPDWPRALAELHRVLRPGGRLFAMTNGRSHMQELNVLVNQVAPGTVREEESGFSLERTKGVDSRPHNPSFEGWDATPRFPTLNLNEAQITT